MEALALRPPASSTDQRSPQASPSPWCTWTMVLMPSSQGRGANQDQEMLGREQKPARAAQQEGQVLGQTGIVTLGDQARQARDHGRLARRQRDGRGGVQGLGAR